MVNIFFVRHGEYEYNVLEKMNFDPTKIIHLDETGKEQAKEAKEKLKKIKFDKIITSNFTRCRETAKIILKTKCPTMSHNVPQCGTKINSDKRLNEMKIGNDSDSYKSHRERINSQILKNKILENDESIKNKIKKLKEFLQDIKNESKEKKFKNVLVVTHKDIIRLFKIINKELELKKFYNYSPKNCEIYKIKLE